MNSATGMSINQDVYMNRCLQPNLLPFLDGELEKATIFSGLTLQELTMLEGPWIF